MQTFCTCRQSAYGSNGPKLPGGTSLHVTVSKILLTRPSSGRRGVFIQSTPQGRRGLLRTFWADGESELNVLSSSMEAYFDFDTREGEDPEVFGRQQRSSICVSDNAVGDADILRRCFRFRFERSWQDYYERAQLTSVQATALSHHALGYDSDRYTRIVGILFAPRYSSRPAASASDARAS